MSIAMLSLALALALLLVLGFLRRVSARRHWHGPRDRRVSTATHAGVAFPASAGRNDDDGVRGGDRPPDDVSRA